MNQIIEGQVPQNTPANGGGTPTTPEVVTIPKSEWDDTKHRADVSSQNFERLKTATTRIGELEGQLQNTNPVPSDLDTERVEKLETQVENLTAQAQKTSVLEKYPVLKDKWADLETFRALDENKGMNLQTAAKAFVTEKGLLEPPREGLERGTGGPHTPIKTGMTSAEVADLRKNNWRKYQDMLLKGQIVIKD